MASKTPISQTPYGHVTGGTKTTGGSGISLNGGNTVDVLNRLQQQSLLLGYNEQRAASEKLKNSYMDNLKIQLDVVAELQNQIYGANRTEVSSRMRAANLEQSRLQVAAGEAGIGGITAARLANAPMADAGRDVGNLNANTRDQITQSNLDRASLIAQTESRINGIPIPNAAAVNLQLDMLSLNNRLQEQLTVDRIKSGR